MILILFQVFRARCAIVDHQRHSRFAPSVIAGALLDTAIRFPLLLLLARL